MYPNIEAERARKGLTKEELASILGVDRKTLRKWVNGGNIPTNRSGNGGVNNGIQTVTV